MSIKKYFSYIIAFLIMAMNTGCEIKSGEEPYFFLIRTCVVEGSRWAGSTQAGGEINRNTIFSYFLGQVSPIWAQAHFVFVPVVSEGNGNIPVIADPEDVFDPGAISGQQSFNAEASEAAFECKQAWEARGVSQGIVVVFARYLIPEQLGYVYGVTEAMHLELIEPNGSRSADLCSTPRKLQASDLPTWVIVTEPGCKSFELACSDFASTRAHEALAHELGHVLLLGHGNGKDDAPSTGTVPPAAGPRPYDEYCDPGENDTALPCADTGLMNSVAGCTGLTELQIETARNAAEACSGGDYTCP
jgi:hypothetical protein